MLKQTFAPASSGKVGSAWLASSLRSRKSALLKSGFMMTPWLFLLPASISNETIRWSEDPSLSHTSTLPRISPASVQRTKSRTWSSLVGSSTLCTRLFCAAKSTNRLPGATAVFVAQSMYGRLKSPKMTHSNLPYIISSKVSCRRSSSVAGVCRLRYTSTSLRILRSLNCTCRQITSRVSVETFRLTIGSSESLTYSTEPPLFLWGWVFQRWRVGILEAPPQLTSSAGQIQATTHWYQRRQSDP